ncbi:DUF2892 domain-containing protein [Paucibacter sediminis]|uniref:DUF2892 domain-containing protein n=1 Tax=Paucibacter sediminis TaxID=3019553 RepID=A0AA95ND04_9BURK|nr:DUF2892 domain-containing protein [Paucibacter sp. S2-9]WIT12792.1 DUF2892 domain-containing protein [Paucibacter sp. S2-9]
MFFIKRNLPHWERALRILMGLLMGGAVFMGWFGAGPLSWMAGAAAATLASTALVGFCPACAMLGRRALKN